VISLDGCLAHVASGSARWACGGLRQCEPCGFSKQDVLAESRSALSAPIDRARDAAAADGAASSSDAAMVDAPPAAAAVRASASDAAMVGSPPAAARKDESGQLLKWMYRGGCAPHGMQTIVAGGKVIDDLLGEATVISHGPSIEFSGGAMVLRFTGEGAAACQLVSAELVRCAMVPPTAPTPTPESVPPVAAQGRDARVMDQALGPDAHTNGTQSEAGHIRRSGRLAAQSGYKAPQGWFLPDGFRVQRKAPSAEELDDEEPEEDTLVGKRISYNWLPPVCVSPTCVCPSRPPVWRVLQSLDSLAWCVHSMVGALAPSAAGMSTRMMTSPST
jgi:hypothetical protein